MITSQDDRIVTYHTLLDTMKWQSLIAVDAISDEELRTFGLGQYTAYKQGVEMVNAHRDLAALRFQLGRQLVVKKRELEELGMRTDALTPQGISYMTGEALAFLHMRAAFNEHFPDIAQQRGTA